MPIEITVWLVVLVVAAKYRPRCGHQRPPPLLPEWSPVLLRALSARLAMTLTVKVLASLLSGEVLLSLHGLALLTLLRVTSLLSTVLLAAHATLLATVLLAAHATFLSTVLLSTTMLLATVLLRATVLS